MKLKYFAATASVAALAMSSAAIAADYKVEISLETGPNHVRNISVVKMAAEIEKASGGRLEMKVFHGASKYKGTNVPTALAQGALDMGLPVTFHLGKFIPEYNISGLPLMFGRSRADQYKVWDGAVGKELNRRAEKKLNIKVLGRWFDLGYGNMFFINKEVKSFADVKGLKMRAPGGAANLARYEGFEATAVKIAWPDVPQALQRGTVDGLLTTHESVRSAKLWDAGIKFAFDDQQTFIQYIPAMSMKAWKKLPADIQKLILDTWEAKIDGVRKFALERQNSARADGAKNGIKRVDAAPADILAMRKKLMKSQAALVKKLKIDPKLVKQAAAILGD